MTISVTAHELHKSYEGEAVLQGLTGEFESGKSYGIVGPSGSGKTTLLRLLAFLDHPTSGEVTLTSDDKLLFSSDNKGLHKHDNVATLYPTLALLDQDNALWPHHTLWKNICICRAPATNESDLRHWSTLLGIDHVLSKTPDTCSKGQNKRAELLRLLAARPAIALLDEPAAALDDITEAQVAQVMKAAQDAFGCGFVIASHSPEILTELKATVYSIAHGKMEVVLIN